MAKVGQKKKTTTKSTVKKKSVSPGVDQAKGSPPNFYRETVKDAQAIIDRIEAFKEGLNPSHSGAVLLAALEADARSIINRLFFLPRGG